MVVAAGVSLALLGAALTGLIVSQGSIIAISSELALAGSALWYGTSISNFLGRIDEGSNTIVGQLKLPGAAFGLTAAFGYVWATDRDDGLLLKIQPA